MKKWLYSLYLLTAGVVIFFSIYGYSLYRQRPGLPQDIDKSIIVSVDGIEIRQEREIDEFILSQKRIGNVILISTQIDGEEKQITVELQPYYADMPIPLIYFLIGSFVIVTGIIVFILRPDNKKARVYFWMSLAFSFSVVINGGFYFIRESWISFFPGTLFYLFYSLAPALLLHFAFQFSHKRPKLKKGYIFLMVYSPPIIFAAVLMTSYLLITLQNSINIFRFYLTFMNIFRVYLVLYASLAVGHLIRLYTTTFLEEQRAQIKWALFGLTIGLTPFLLLNQFPQVFGMTPPVSEELTNLFFLIIPVTFAVSILKYKLMNIDLIINRSMVYSLLSIFIVCIYLVTVRLLQSILMNWLAIQEMTLSVIAALVTASTFHPLRRKIQVVVDKSFFRLSYDYKKSIHDFIDKSKNMISAEHLINYFLLKIDKTLPIEKIGVFVYSVQKGRPRILYQRNGLKDHPAVFQAIRGKSEPLARKAGILTDKGIDFSIEKELENNSLEIIIPMFFQLTKLEGYLTFGEKRSGERYNSEDFELIQTMSHELALNLERIQLQEEIILEKAEKEKLLEVDRLKTEFISSVSHEIRTPMSSIQGLSELLQEEKIQDKEKRDELLGLMSSECTRLSRFLHNILDFGKIEKKTKTFNFENTELIAIVEGTLKLQEHQIQSAGFKLKTHLPEKEISLNIDQDAVKQALINLIDNAMKYSQKEKEIEVSITDRNKEVEIQVKDKGIGIPLVEQKKIFNGFYRSKEASQLSPKGVGLGLKIVKHIMDAHKGRIEIKSQMGEGSVLSLIFLKIRR